MPNFNTILLTGKNGQVGHALASRLPTLGHLITLDRSQLDLSNADAIRKIVQETKPDLIINPAAYTAVDRAESESGLAYAINARAPGLLAQAAAEVGARLVHYSTDYVFDGRKTSPYVETDDTNPLNIYGASKLAGEQAIRASGVPHLIFRTSWVYGSHGNNFLLTMLRLAAERDNLRVVADQEGAPTSSICIAEATVQAIENWHDSKTGIYHLTNAGATSWHGFCLDIIEQYDKLRGVRGWPALKIKPSQITAITTKDYPTPAIRPSYSLMNGQKIEAAFGISLPPWQTGLSNVMATL